MTQIKVNKEIWEELTAQDKRDIKDALIRAGSINGGDEIVGDASIEAAPEDDAKDESISISDACTSACKATYDVAKGACNLNWSKKKRRACRNAAYGAYQICLAACRA